MVPMVLQNDCPVSPQVAVVGLGVDGTTLHESMDAACDGGMCCVGAHQLAEPCAF